MPYEKMTMPSRKCPWCDKEFVPVYNAHIFCSRKCRQLYVKKNGKAPEPPTIIFECAQCGRKVQAGGKDRRTRFCSRECEHKYWKHPPYETEPRNQMFKSLGSAESHEKWTNKIWSGS